MTPIECSELFWQGTKVTGLHAVLIDETGDLHAAIGQVVDQASITHIAIDHCRAAHCYRFDNEGAVFMASRERNSACASQHLPDGGVILFAPGRPVICVKSGLAPIACSTV